MPDMREEFEAWLLREHGLESEWQEDRNCFKDYPAHLAFKAWQASRANLLKDHVPMPRQCPSWLEDAYDDAWGEDNYFIDGLSLPAYEAMLKAQEEALQQAGIEVK